MVESLRLHFSAMRYCAEILIKCRIDKLYIRWRDKMVVAEMVM